MSEHTPLTEAAEVLHDAGWYGRADLTTAQLDGILLTLFNADCLAARMSTATADTGLRERVEALADEFTGSALGTDFFGNTLSGWVPVERLRAALDATPASTEDRADNEGTR